MPHPIKSCIYSLLGIALLIATSCSKTLYRYEGTEIHNELSLQKDNRFILTLTSGKQQYIGNYYIEGSNLHLNVTKYNGSIVTKNQQFIVQEFTLGQYKIILDEVYYVLVKGVHEKK